MAEGLPIAWAYLQGFSWAFDGFFKTISIEEHGWQVVKGAIIGRVELNCFFEAVLWFLDLLYFREGDSQIIEGVAIGRIQFESLLEAEDGFCVVMSLGKQNSKVVVRSKTTGIQS